MALIIRQAGPEDAELVAKLVVRLLGELEHREVLPDPGPYLATTRMLLDDPAHFASFIALLGDRVVAVMNLNSCAAIYAGGRFGEITEFFVAPDCRSVEVGRRLLEQAKVYGRDQGWQRLEVGAPDLPDGWRAQGFYQKNGFEDVGPRLRCLL